ncbi:MAG TPA: hypothetical protein VFW91_22270, partial [Candidatus Binatia bacterium]|nr:hypothetical protein [Candidatus Binatia bacterium]
MGSEIMCLIRGSNAADTLHSKSPIAREVIVEAVADFAGGKIELRAVVVRGGIDPPLFCFCALGESQPDSVPAFVIFDLRRNRANFLDPSRRRAIEQWPAERVIHPRIGQHMH